MPEPVSSKTVPRKSLVPCDRLDVGGSYPAPAMLPGTQALGPMPKAWFVCTLGKRSGTGSAGPPEN